MAIRPNPSNKMAHTMIEVVDDPVDGIEPDDVPDVLPP